MSVKSIVRSVGRWAAMAAGIGAGTYAAYAGVTWLRYGRVNADDEADSLLDEFMPVYEVVERHSICVSAPAETTLAAACGLDLEASPLIRGLIRTRALVLGGKPERREAIGLLDEMQSIGWGLLAEIPGREIVVGSVTRPWEGNVVFHAIPAREFAAFREPGWVKIAWTLRADPMGDNGSVARTETRAVATDPMARAKFRRYWALVLPGIALIRRSLLRSAKRKAEQHHAIESATGSLLA